MSPLPAGLALRGLDGGRGQTGKAGQHVEVGAGEARRVERVQRQHAPGLFVQIERAAQAVVYFQMCAVTLYQSVIGVGQRTVGGEAGRFAAFEQCRQARVLGDQEVTAQRVRAQAVYRQRYQTIAVQPQQRGGVAGQQFAQRLQKSSIALLRRQVARQVVDQRNQCGQQRMCGHCDSTLSK
jgi:hypothetical protein